MDDFMNAETQEELQNTISMFEQILEVMPGDQLALRTLYKAYLQLEERGRAFDRLCRLADVLVEEGESEDVFYLIDQFGLFRDYAPEAAGERLEALRSLEAGRAGGDSGDGGLLGASADADLDQEMGLAWRLFQEELLSQEEYSGLLTDLTELSARDLGTPATVLHVLADRGFKHISRVFQYITEHSGAPFISLSGFEFTESVSDALPLEFMQRRAAIVFGELGGELMLAVVNPFNLDLVRDVERITGRKCHVYLVGSGEYDLVLSSRVPGAE